MSGRGSAGERFEKRTRLSETVTDQSWPGRAEYLEGLSETTPLSVGSSPSAPLSSYAGVASLEQAYHFRHRSGYNYNKIRIVRTSSNQPES